MPFMSSDPKFPPPPPVRYLRRAALAVAVEEGSEVEHVAEAVAVDPSAERARRGRRSDEPIGAGIY